MFTVLLRKASGAGYYAMAGLPYDPIVQLSTPISRLSVMEGRTLAIATYNTKLDDDFRIETTDAEERKKIEQGMVQVEARIEGDMNPVVAASQMDTDEIVDIDALRSWLVTLIEMTYQGTGQRRIKNPRIWSMHDLALLGERGAPVSEAAASSTQASEKQSTAPDAQGLVFRAPLAGRVYFRPAPDKPSFIEVGSTVAAGTTVCLLEVMKSFNRIAYGGASLPERARVVRLLVEDGADVNAGTPMFEVVDAALT
jgi:biotin carboxyl carrier protein